MDAIKSIRRNPIGTMFIGGIAISLIFSQGNIRQNASAIDGARQIAQANAANQLQLQATEQANQQRAKIAESRYQSGCVVVVALNDPGQFTTLSEGQPVLDRARNAPFPVGTVVCDSFGNTAVIAPDASGQPVATQLAFTGNKAIVQAAVNGIPAQLNQPLQ